ncbi:KH homology domain-containing protein 1B-like [Rattus rattus]|uniref:KH homology domain-containing protein 1B-like n=1 Tax=Rattus rattus TaxID=10117 RepID=UPI0013F316D6|nr:KH homology domain-containing protein 1B-like [Rattus rattus]
MSDPHGKAWWNIPYYFYSPLMFYMEEDLEEYIFGPEDEYLRRMEVHSNTLIQLERGFTASGQTRVSVVGPFQARLWVMNMIRKVGSQNTFDQTTGKIMLLRIRSQPLSEQDLKFDPESGSSLWFPD